MPQYESSFIYVWSHIFFIYKYISTYIEKERDINPNGLLLIFNCKWVKVNRLVKPFSCLASSMVRWLLAPALYAGNSLNAPRTGCQAPFAAPLFCKFFSLGFFVFVVNFWLSFSTRWSWDWHWRWGGVVAGALRKQRMTPALTFLNWNKCGEIKNNSIPNKLNEIQFEDDANLN